MLVTSKDMLEKARENKYAIGAFNADNLEITRAVIAAAQEMHAPVMVQVTPVMGEYGGLENYAAIVMAEAKQVNIPVCLHLDHGNGTETAKAALEAGYTSVMFDGSHISYEENVAKTKEIVALAEKYGVPVEAELGRIGGTEDGVSAVADSNTDPAQAKDFIEKTGASSLAIAIGTAHGFYTGTPVLDKKRVSELKELVSVPLVLHGASGLSEEEVRECVERGICKVNFATELRVAYTDAIKKLLAEKPQSFDPKEFGKVGMEAVKEVVKDRIKMCGCDNKA